MLEKEIKARGYCHYCYHHLLNSKTLPLLYKKLLPQSLTSIQNSILIGGLLGDFSMRKRGNQNTSLSVSRSYVDKEYVDKEYLEWEFDLFKDFCSGKPKECLIKRKCHKDNLDKWFTKLQYNNDSHIKIIDLGNGFLQKEFKQIRFETRNVPIFNDIYYKWYPEPDKIKIAPNDL